ncbi:MAG: polysaccharide deacetylase family protein [Deltaproteobacteria bacterium]|nr:polysaccharide deacetylase family protein [Deltaproteobacteria bacterium]
MKTRVDLMLSRSPVGIFFAVGLLLLSLCSCVTTGTGSDNRSAGSADRQPGISAAYRSQDYILYELQGGETPESLAREFLGDPKKRWVIQDNNEGIPYKKGRLIVIPLREEPRGGLYINGYQKVPILTYHRFGGKTRSRLSMPADLFDQQMAYLKENGYRVIPLSDLIGFMQFRTALPKKAVVITIDDGYKSVYDIAFPILKKYGFTATLFIYLDFIGIPGSSLTWDQLRQMKAEGFEVGSHTLSHCNLIKRRKDEDQKTYMERVKRELFLSKQIIDRKLGQDTFAIAFPYGTYNREILKLCKKAGYRLGLSVKRGGNPFFLNPLSLNRSQLLQRDLDYFIRNLDTFQDVSLR